MAGWALISWIEGSLPCLLLKSRSQDLISLRRVDIMEDKGERRKESEHVR